LAVPAALLRFGLSDGRPASLLVGEASTVLSVDDALVSSWDLCGRPYALVRESGTYRRGLDGGMLRKREATAEGPRVRCRLTAAEGGPLIEAARRDAGAALAALASPTAPVAHAAEAIARLRTIVGMDERALAADAARFLAASGPVGILPPDQYLALVVRVTEGCSWNACSFCRLYRDVPFRVRTRPQLEQHVLALRTYFGRSIALRRSLFLGDANALCLAHDRLLPLLEVVAGAFPGAPLASFVDAWSGGRRSADEWRALAALGLRRVYVGLESGDAELLCWLEKAGSPADAVTLVHALHEAGIAVGVIVLVGAGGNRFSEAHVRGTAEVLDAMQLGREDLLYFSAYVDDPSLRYGAKAATAADLLPLSAERAAGQRSAITAALCRGRSHPVRTATYDIREFVY
jgi:hypothetical protein